MYNLINIYNGGTDMHSLVKDTLKLGFGLMRLPRIDKETPDLDQIIKMVDTYMEAGGKYFDTAYIYGDSEQTIRKALCERHPRDSYYLASKLNASDFCCESEEKAKKEIYESLERTGAGYFDFYLLHAIGEDNIGKYEEYGLFEFVKGLKEQGLVKHIGFSFHDSAAMLEKLLNDHPEFEFVQLQINYADWESDNIQSRKCYEVASAHDMPVIVMEPVKGGSLADPPETAKKYFTGHAPDASPSSWAIRFAASLPDVMIVLSGMSTIEQMEDNLSYMKDFIPLDEKEQEIIVKVREAIESIDLIPCTSCHYCTPGCPMEIRIPELFEVMNQYRKFNNLQIAKKRYAARAKEAPASVCIQCGQCESACPQHLPIISLLEETAGKFE